MPWAARRFAKCGLSVIRVSPGLFSKFRFSEALPCFAQRCRVGETSPVGFFGSPCLPRCVSASVFGSRCFGGAFPLADVREDLRLTKSEAEQERQAQAAGRLYRRKKLPKNMSEMKSYAWGRFTWRDLLMSGAALGIPIVLLLPLQVFIPVWVCVLVGALIGAYPVFLVNRHVLTGDLPIEEKIRIKVGNIGERDLLSWDKTRVGDSYTPYSTQSFVPDVSFTDDGYAILPGNQGGFSAIRIEIDDITKSKYTEQEGIVLAFSALLNRLVTNNECVPIQLYMKAKEQQLDNYVQQAISDTYRASRSGADAMSARAADQARLLYKMDTVVRYMYEYYVIVTYRDDAEDVGNDSMNTFGVKREQLKEKANPFKKQMDATRDVDFKIGDDRAKMAKRYLKEKQFGYARTVAALEKRTRIVLGALSSMGTAAINVNTELLSKSDMSRLFYDCYNESTKYTTDTLLEQALHPKIALLSDAVYEDFPELFSKPKERDSVIDEAYRLHGKRRA